jgi:hypothetical protein
VQRSERLLLENLAAYEAFASAVLDYVAKGKENRGTELQQRLTDYAAAILQAYEVTSGRALQAVINNILENLPREVIHAIYKELPAPQQSLLRRPWAINPDCIGAQPKTQALLERGGDWCISMREVMRTLSRANTTLICAHLLSRFFTMPRSTTRLRSSQAASSPCLPSTMT